MCTTLEGAALIGDPIVEIGHNATLAWSHTVSTARRFVWQRLRLVPGDPTAYLFDGQSEKMTPHTVTVQVMLPTGTVPVTRTMYATRFGPVVVWPGAFPWTTSTACAITDVNTTNNPSVRSTAGCRSGRAGSVRQRNAAFADLLFESGLRLREGGSLLTLEVPDAIQGYAYYEGTVAAAIAKRRERMFYLNADALSGIETYLATTRRAAIRHAQRTGRYDRLRGKQIVTKISRGRQRRLFWQDGKGNKGDAPINAIDAGERQRLFIEADDGLEPLQLWLTEGGMPMDYRSWEKVFSAANDRCARHGKPIYVTPHACRHSFALKMLVTLERALDARFGLDRSERDHARKVYGDAFALVKDLLGHSSEETTRKIYLAPLNGLRLRSILNGTEGENLDAILTLVAHASRLVMDVGPAEEEG